jgi:hypothetical protein
VVFLLYTISNVDERKRTINGNREKRDSEKRKSEEEKIGRRENVLDD